MNFENLRHVWNSSASGELVVFIAEELIIVIYELSMRKLMIHELLVRVNMIYVLPAIVIVIYEFFEAPFTKKLKQKNREEGAFAMCSDQGTRQRASPLPCAWSRHTIKSRSLPCVSAHGKEVDDINPCQSSTFL